MSGLLCSWKLRYAIYFGLLVAMAAFNWNSRFWLVYNSGLLLLLLVAVFLRATREKN